MYWQANNRLLNVGHRTEKGKGLHLLELLTVLEQGIPLDLTLNHQLHQLTPLAMELLSPLICRMLIASQRVV